MNRLPIAAVTAVALIVIIGGGVLFLRGNDQGVGGPSATPSPSPSASAPAASGAIVRTPVPETMRGTWVADVDPIVGLGSTDTRLRFVMSSLGDTSWLATNGSGNDTMYSAPTEVTGDGLVLTTIKEGVGCKVGDRGRYQWTLSSDGVNLDLKAVDDACATRSATLARSWFRGFDGVTNGGRAALTNFDPAFLVTLPNAAFMGSGGPDSMDVDSAVVTRTLMATKDPWGYTKPCTSDGGAKLPIAPGADAFVAYMRTIPGVQVNTTELKVDGHRAVRLTAPVSAKVDCPTSKILEWTPKNPENNGGSHIKPGDTDIVYVVELPDATYLLQYLGDGVTTAEEEQILSTVHFLNSLTKQP